MSRGFGRARARVWLCLGLLLSSLPFTAGAAGLLEKEHPLIQQGRRRTTPGGTRTRCPPSSRRRRSGRTTRRWTSTGATR
ncbi:hypothetical protein ACN28S_43550 [Cystobacter fuscus]